MQFRMTDDALLLQAMTELRRAGYKVRQMTGRVDENENMIHVDADLAAEREVERIVLKVNPGALRFGI